MSLDQPTLRAGPRHANKMPKIILECVLMSKPMLNSERQPPVPLLLTTFLQASAGEEADSTSTHHSASCHYHPLCRQSFMDDPCNTTRKGQELVLPSKQFAATPAGSTHREQLQPPLLATTTTVTLNHHLTPTQTTSCYPSMRTGHVKMFPASAASKAFTRAQQTRLADGNCQM